MQFGARKPKANLYVKTDVSSHYNGGFHFDQSFVSDTDMLNVANNSKHRFLECRADNFGEMIKYNNDDFDIVDDKGKWNCMYKYCNDIDCDETKLGYYPEYLEGQFTKIDVIPEIKYWDYKDKELKDLPKYRYYDGKTLTELLYDPVKKNRCVRKSWDGGRCLEYVCKDCYNCDTRTGQCLDTFLSKAACAAKKIKYKKGENEIPGCNYESFTEGYTD